MPNPLQSSLHGYLSKIKRETEKLQLTSSKSLSTSKKWVLAGCKQSKKLSSSFKHRRGPSSKTRSNDDHHQDSSQAATLADIDRFLEENFKSLCIRDGSEEEEEEDHHHWKKKEKMHQSSDEDDDEYRHRFERTWGPAVYDSPKLTVPPRRTERLSPPPGSSSEGRPSMYNTMSEEEEGEERPSLRSKSNSSSTVLPENCIAVLRYTEDPQEDFRRSMVEMMESKLGGSEVDWDLMEELLFSYLDLNDKKSHKFILSAFVDLIISLRDKEKRITRTSLERSLSIRAAARMRLSKRSDAFRN